MKLVQAEVIKIVDIGGKELAKILHYYGFNVEEAATFKIICPFHNDINPSLIVDLVDGFWLCFGCDLAGNAFDFVKHVNADKNDLQCWLIYFNILKSKKVKALKIKTITKVRVEKKQALKEAKYYYRGLLTIDWTKPSKMYKEEYKYLKKRGLSAKILNKAGAKITFNKSYPIIFPMFDMGKYRGWVCRTTNKYIESKRKYLYNEGFSKSTTIVGRYDNETVMLVEGYFDFIKAKIFKVQYVGAILGWKITQEQILKLREQGVKNVICALDNDEAGKKGTEYLKNFFNVIEFQFPSNRKDLGAMNEKEYKIAKIKTDKLIRRI